MRGGKKKLLGCAKEPRQPDGVCFSTSGQSTRLAASAFRPWSTLCRDREAFVGVLACAAADGNYPEAERDLPHLICRHHPFTRDLGAEANQLIVAAIKYRLAAVGWEAAIGEYLGRVPDECALLTLLSVIDICLIDAEEHDRKLECIAWVADRFRIALKAFTATCAVPHQNGMSEWNRASI